jgi:hypothetical protein
VVSEKPWGSIKESDYATPEAFCRACLIDLNDSTPKSKDKCKLPVREPGGALNRNGVHAAAAALAGARGGVQAPVEDKAKAARALIRLYGQLDEEPPESIVSLAKS